MIKILLLIGSVLLVGCMNTTSNNSPLPQEQSLWLTSKLYGSDNNKAALRRVIPTADADRYKIFITNQYAFECGLEFDAQGYPHKLLNCQSKLNPGDQGYFDQLVVKEPEIILTCDPLQKEVVCKGKYTLQTSQLSLRSVMTIARTIASETP